MMFLLREIRCAMRALRRSPALTLAALLSLALGIGGTSLVFTVIDRVLLRPLPIRNPRQLVQLVPHGSIVDSGSRGDGSELSYPHYVALHDVAVRNAERGSGRPHDGLLARVPAPLHLGAAASADAIGTERVVGELVSGSYFPVLGVTAAIGRTIGPGDERPGRPAVVIANFAHWQRRFAGDPAAVERRVVVNGNPATLIGVARLRWPRSVGAGGRVRADCDAALGRAGRRASG